MADKPKKKLKIKKKGSGTIANQIAAKQKKKATDQKREAEVKKSQVSQEQAASAPSERPVSSPPPKTSPDTRRTDTRAPKDNIPNKNTSRTVFIDPEANVPPKPQPQGTGKHSKKNKQNSHLREDILKQEEHKKFFLGKQKKGGKGKRSNQQQQSPQNTEQRAPAAASIPKDIKITEFVQVGELARKLNVKTPEIIAKLMQMGVMATITQSIDADTATLVASEYGTTVKVVSLYDETVIQEKPDEDADLEPRPPVVTIMGHVDHGKTKLLDALRKTDIVSSEAGGITQHIGAYQITRPKGKITFLDTPGHEAFTAMRARGAQITDIVVLIVAADDGVMPQTIEAIHHAKDANVPIIVAINKIDLPEANPDKIRQELSSYDLVSEEWGGTTPFVEVSAKSEINLDTLEDVILAQSEIMEIKANPNKKAVGTVIEAKLDQGRGPVATILINSGTLKQGDAFVVGLEGGRIRAMVNDHGQKIKEAGPAMPVEILGLGGVPNAGDPFHVMDSEKEAKSIVEKRQELHRQQQAKKITKVKLENLNEFIEQGQIQELKLIIKADVRGSVEAIQSSLEKLSNEEVKVNVIYGGTGEITESDVMLASAANALVIGFNTRANARVKEVASRESVDIAYYSIIYQVIDDIKSAMVGMLSPDISERITGEIEIRQTFKISAVGTAAGCMVTSGLVKRNSKVRLIREGVVIYTGKLKSLKRFQDDANEVKEGFECGILIDGYNDIKEGDIVEAFEEVEVSRTLDDIKVSEENSSKAESTEETNE